MMQGPILFYGELCAVLSDVLGYQGLLVGVLWLG